MRLDIKTKGKIKDRDVRALYILNEGIKTSTERMTKANLEFVLSKYGYSVVKNPTS